jgi:hypothetical protein
VFSRQAGKDETTAQLLAYMLELYQSWAARLFWQRRPIARRLSRKPG